MPEDRNASNDSRSSERDGLRAADTDRQYVADRLRDALNEGRLTLTEYDDRLGEAYSARTYGDLRGLLSDLPTVAPTASSQMVPSSPLMPPAVPAAAMPPGNLTAQWLFHEWSNWFKLSLIMVAIWLFTDAGGYFWPVWVIGPLGVVTLGQTISGLANGEPRKRYDRQQRRAAERDERRAAERERRDSDRDRNRDQDRDRDND